MDRCVRETETLPEQSIEIQDLVVSQTNFVGVMEALIQKLDLHEGNMRLKILKLDGLNKDQLFNDQHLVERFARGSLSLRKLFIGNIRQTRRETRDALAHMV